MDEPNANSPTTDELTPETASSLRITIVCRSAQCGQKIGLEAGKEGTVVCPNCKRRFWASTREQSAALRAIRTVLKNQEGVALAATILLGLAAVWLSALWFVRESFAYSVHFSLAGAIGSWLLLTWALKRKNVDHLLAGALKEARLFFALLAVASAVFCAFHFWRFGTGDPLTVSGSLLELEQMRDRLRQGDLVAWLREPQLRVALALMGLLAIGLRLKSIRDAVRGVTKQAAQGAKVLVYALIALSAFTFGGVLHDAAVSRVAPVVNAQHEQITKGFEAYVDKELPLVLDELVAQAMLPPEEIPQDDPPQDLPQSQPEDDDESPPVFVARPEEPPPAGPSAASVTPSAPGPPGPKPGAASATVARASESFAGHAVTQLWLAELKTDATAVIEKIGEEPVATRESSSENKPERAALIPASSTTLEDVQRLSQRPQSPAPPTATEADAELRNFLKSGLKLAMAGHVPESSSVLDTIDGTHPFTEQLKSVASQLIDSPVQDAVRELISEVFARVLKATKNRTREWIRQRLAVAPPDSPLGRLVTAARKLRRDVTDTAQELNAGARSPAPNVDAALQVLQRRHAARWQDAIEQLGEDLRGKAQQTYDAVENQLKGKDRIALANTYSSNIKALENGLSYGILYSETAEAVASIETDVLGTGQVREAIDSLKAERARERKETRKWNETLWKRVANQTVPEPSPSDVPGFDADAFTAGVRGTWVVTENEDYPGKLFVHRRQEGRSLVDLMYHVKVEANGEWSVYRPDAYQIRPSYGTFLARVARPAGVKIGPCSCR
jgi:hypothetical protein